MKCGKACTPCTALLAFVSGLMFHKYFGQWYEGTFAEIMIILTPLSLCGLILGLIKQSKAREKKREQAQHSQ